MSEINDQKSIDMNEWLNFNKVFDLDNYLYQSWRVFDLMNDRLRMRRVGRRTGRVGQSDAGEMGHVQPGEEAAKAGQDPLERKMEN